MPQELVLVVGATGFMGEHVVERLAKAGRPFRCFVRQTSNLEPIRRFDPPLSYGTLEDVDSLTRALDGASALICCASLGFGHAPYLLEACRRAGLRRAVFTSTTGIFTRLEPESKRVRLEAERLINESGLDFTILRPTMIYGTERDRNMCRLLRRLARSRVFVIPGSGRHLQQPIHVEDLADAAVSVLDAPVCIGKSYNLGGAHPLSFNQVVDAAAAALGRSVLKLHIPLSLALYPVMVYNKLSRKPLIKTEQLLRLEEDKAFDISEARADFGFNPIRFEEGIRREAARLRARGLIR